jgi:hypothetical protein
VEDHHRGELGPVGERVRVVLNGRRVHGLADLGTTIPTHRHHGDASGWLGRSGVHWSDSARASRTREPMCFTVSTLSGV